MHTQLETQVSDKKENLVEKEEEIEVLEKTQKKMVGTKEMIAQPKNSTMVLRKQIPLTMEGKMKKGLTRYRLTNEVKSPDK